MTGAIRLLMGVLALAVSVSAYAQGAGETRTPVLDYPFVDSYMDYRVYDLPPELVYTERFGQWAEGGRSGLHRLVVVETLGDASPQQLLYLQWVCRCEAGVVAMRPVSEINRSSQMTYTRPEFSRIGLRDVVELEGRDRLTGQLRTFRVRMMAVGEYELEFN